MSGVRLVKKKNVLAFNTTFPRVTEGLYIPSLNLEKSQEENLHTRAIEIQRILHHGLKRNRIHAQQQENYTFSSQQIKFCTKEMEALVRQLWTFLQQISVEPGYSALSLERHSYCKTTLQGRYSIKLDWQPISENNLSTVMSLQLNESSCSEPLGELILINNDDRSSSLKISISAIVPEGYFGADMVERILFNLFSLDQDYRRNQLFNDLKHIRMLSRNFRNES